MLVSFSNTPFRPNFQSSGKYAFLSKTFESPKDAIKALTEEYNALSSADKLSMKAMMLLDRIKQYRRVGLTPVQIEQLERESTLRQIGVLAEDCFGHVPKEIKNIIPIPDESKSRKL